MIIQVMVVLKKEVVGDRDSNTLCEVIFSIQRIVFVTLWCFKSGLLKVIDLLSHDDIG